MIVFVPIGREVTLSATLSGEGVDAITTASFEVYRTTSSGEEVVATVQGAVADRRATCPWTAAGPKPEESGCSVYYRVTAGELRASGADEIVVYRDRLEVKTLSARGGPAQPGTLCALKITVDPLFKAPPNVRIAAERVRRADGEGVAVFENLPPGRWEVSFRSPFQLVAWTVPQGPRREAVVERLVRARFVSPDPTRLENGIHKQWVNLTTDPTAVVQGHPDRGPVLKVRAEVVPENGPGRTGDRIYMRAVFGGENSMRNDPAPAFEGQAGGRGVRTTEVSKALTADGGSVEFTVNLGLAGGDSVTLELGGTPACQDASLVVVNWRRLFVRPVRPRDYVLPGEELSQNVKSLLAAQFTPGFIELEFERATVLPDNSNGTVVPPEITRHYPKLPQGQNLIFLGGSPEKAHFTGGATHPPRFNLLLGHVIAKKSTETQVFPVTGARSDWRPSKEGGTFYKVPFDGTPFLGETSPEVPERPKTRREIVRYTSPAKGSPKPVYEDVPTGEMLPAVPAVGSYVEVSGVRHMLDDTCVEISADTQTFRLNLPPAAARAVSKKTPGTVTLKVTTYSFQGGSSTGNWISAVWAGEANDLKGTVNITHEIGHSVGMAPSDGEKYPGLPTTHDETYGSGGVTDGDQHGHEGPHCGVGLTARQKQTPDYSTLVDQGIHGSCIMFGGVGAKTRYASLKFCAKCLPFLRATTIREI
ncbi:MAG: hypothetical protein U0325_22975 [Polyangiales bacterium]